MNVTHIHKCAHIYNTPQTSRNDSSPLNSTQINGIIGLHSSWFLQMHTHIFMLPVFRQLFTNVIFIFLVISSTLDNIFAQQKENILTLSSSCPISLNNLKTLTEKRIQNYKSRNMKLTELCRMDAVFFFFFSLSRQNITVRNNIVLHFK